MKYLSQVMYITGTAVHYSFYTSQYLRNTICVRVRVTDREGGQADCRVHLCKGEEREERQMLERQRGRDWSDCTFTHCLSRKVH